jgi:hypothetical protein
MNQEMQIEFTDKVQKLKSIVETLNTEYFTHTIINNNNINNCKISIVMTSSNRSKQTYFTLKTISDSINKDIHIILVDDSDTDKIDVEILNKYNFYIDFIEINKSKKCWANPCINYNIGFKYIKCDKIILQNAEVCHIGDVCKYVNDELNSDRYLVFDVITSDSYEQNESIYTNYPLNSTDIISKLSNNQWYQHYTHFNRNFHFLVSFTRNVFNKFKCFSYDYFSEAAYDDNDLVLKLQSLSIEFININNDEKKLCGIHLYHILANKSWESSTIINSYIYNKKLEHYNIYNEYVDIINTCI